MTQVAGGSLTGEKLCDEVIEQISHVKKVKPNAYENIVSEINAVRNTLVVTPEQEALWQYKSHHDELQVLLKIKLCELIT